VAVFAFFFGLFFKQTDYILMFFAITGALFSGAGAAIVGGLYWKRGTAAAGLDVDDHRFHAGGHLHGLPADVGQAPRPLAPDPVPRQRVLLANTAKFPINGVWLGFIAQVVAVSVYVLISFLTSPREGFDMDRMLHRGKFAADAGPDAKAWVRPKFAWSRLIGFDNEFTRGDKIIAGSMFGWNMFWFAIFVIVSIWNIFHRWPLSWWSKYWHIAAILMPLTVGIVTTVWFTWGGVRDLRRMFKALRIVGRDARDDGTVVGHSNLDELNAPKPTAEPAAVVAAAEIKTAIKK